MRELNRNTKRVTANSGKSGTKERKRYKERERERESLTEKGFKVKIDGYSQLPTQRQGDGELNNRDNNKVDNKWVIIGRSGRK